MLKLWQTTSTAGTARTRILIEHLLLRQALLAIAPLDQAPIGIKITADARGAHPIEVEIEIANTFPTETPAAARRIVSLDHRFIKRRKAFGC